jgi:glycosyltransferase involved in cell wall biosynthesis
LSQYELFEPAIPNTSFARVLNSSLKTYRVVHLPTSVGGNSRGLSAQLEKLGIGSETWIFAQNVFNYKCTKAIWTESDNRLLREVRRCLAIVRVALEFDVIHFNSGSSWASPIPKFRSEESGLWIKLQRFHFAMYLELLFFAEISLYRLLRRPLFVHYQGDDARQGDFSRSKFRHSIAQYVDEGYYSPETDALKRRMIRRMSRYCSQVYAVNPDLMHVLGAGARFIPYSHISLDEWQPVYTQLERRPLRIGHAPSHRKVKGTDVILSALEQLAAEGFEYELVLVEGLPNDQARQKYEQIDVLIDQLHAGWYGGLAVEAMALGKPVMVYIREEDLQFIPPEMKADLPVLRVTMETLKADLRRLMQMPRGELHELAQRSRRYVERWHDPLRIAEEIKRDYEEALRARGRI